MLYRQDYILVLNISACLKIIRQVINNVTYDVKNK